MRNLKLIGTSSGLSFAQIRDFWSCFVYLLRSKFFYTASAESADRLDAW